MAYGRASIILGQNVTLFGMDARDGEGYGADWDGLRGAVVGVARLGEVGDLRSGTLIKAGDARSGAETPSAVL